MLKPLSLLARAGAARLAFACVALLADPAEALDGIVLDGRTGTPVAGAEVSILGLGGVAVTDGEGRFTWRPEPTPPFEVLVILPGGRFMRPVLVERVAAGAPLVITVAPLLEETVTVAAGAAPDIETTPASGTALLTGRDLRSRAPANLAQALENVAGVASVSEGHAAVPTVRGLARGRTLILLDGARVSSERRVGPSATFLDPFALEDLEVARGPGSVAYGSDAFGGVIYARTRRAAPGSPLRVRFAGDLGAGIPQARASAEISKGVERGSVLVQARARGARDYRAPGVDVFNSGWRDSGVLARADHALGPGMFSAIWQSDFGRDVERPRDNSRTVRFYYPTEDSHRFTTTYEAANVGGFSRVALNGFFGRSVVITDQDRYATPVRARSVERADVRANDFQVKASVERVVGASMLEGGMDVNGRTGLEALDIVETYNLDGTLAREQVNVSIDSARRTDTGLYASATVPLRPSLLLGGGLRGDVVRTKNEGGYFGDRAVGHEALSGFASVTAGPFRGIRITGQVSSGFRDPTLSDRYYRGPTGRGFITGNPELEPERSLQFDGAVRYTAGRARLAVYGFEYRIDDLVERYQTSTDTFFFRNRGRARLRGLEVELQADLGAGLSADVASHAIRGVALDDGTPLDDVPAESVSLQVRKLWGPGMSVYLRGAATARDDRPGPTEREVPGYLTLDLGASWRPTPRLEVGGIVRNLLDQEYLASQDPRAVPAPGIQGVITLLVQF